MSRTEYHTGKLRKIELTGSIEDKCREICEELGIPMTDEFEESSWKMSLVYHYPPQPYVVINECLYEIYDHKDREYKGINLVYQNKDKEICFVQVFHNGGTDLKECLEKSEFDF